MHPPVSMTISPLREETKRRKKEKEKKLKTAHIKQTSSFWRQIWSETKFVTSAISFSASEFDCSCTCQAKTVKYLNVNSANKILKMYLVGLSKVCNTYRLNFINLGCMTLKLSWFLSKLVENSTSEVRNILRVLNADIKSLYN